MPVSCRNGARPTFSEAENEASQQPKHREFGPAQEHGSTEQWQQLRGVFKGPFAVQYDREHQSVEKSKHNEETQSAGKCTGVKNRGRWLGESDCDQESNRHRNSQLWKADHPLVVGIFPEGEGYQRPDGQAQSEALERTGQQAQSVVWLVEMWCARDEGEIGVEPIAAPGQKGRAKRDPDGPTGQETGARASTQQNGQQTQQGADVGARAACTKGQHNTRTLQRSGRNLVTHATAEKVEELQDRWK